MAALLGELVGAALAMALFGALIALIIRKFSRVSLYASYAIGIALMLPIAAFLYTLGNQDATFPAALLMYGLGGILSFPILVASGKLRGKE